MSDNDEKYAAPADDFPKEKGSGSGTTTGYSVEARYATYDILVLPNGQAFDLRWREVGFNRADHLPGIPEQNVYEGDPVRYGLHTWAAAQALRAWFIAEMSLAHKEYCIETRIVEHVITYSFSVRAVAATEKTGWRDGEQPPRTLAKKG